MKSAIDWKVVRRHLGKLRSSATPGRDLASGIGKVIAIIFRAPDGPIFSRLSPWNSATRPSSDLSIFYKLNSRVRDRFGLPFNFNFSKIELELTTACNLKCNNCDRSCGQAPSTEAMSLEQIDKFIADSVKHGKKWRKIILQGGEPLIHPDIHEILAKFVEYKKKHSPGTFLRITTNGYGTRVQKVLESLPPEINVVNTGKLPLDNEGHIKITGRPEGEFDTYHSASVDALSPEASAAINYRSGCAILRTGGLGLTRYGYYPCGAGASVDRVFGFNVGAKSLEEITEKGFRDGLDKLCRHCGHFKAKGRHDFSNVVAISSRDQVTSASWQTAFGQFKDNRTRLTEF